MTTAPLWRRLLVRNIALLLAVIVGSSLATVREAGAAGGRAGYRWHATTIPLNSGEDRLDGSLDAVSCVASNWCLAVGTLDTGTTESVAKMWNGTSWVSAGVPPSMRPGLTSDGFEDWSVQTPDPSGWFRPTGVACEIANFCIAVGSQATGPIIDTFVGGTGWAAYSTASVVGSFDRTTMRGPPRTQLSGISCSMTICYATGWDDVVVPNPTNPNFDIDEYRPVIITRDLTSTWRRISSDIPTSTLLQGIACDAIGRCLVTGQHQLPDKHWTPVAYTMTPNGGSDPAVEPLEVQVPQGVLNGAGCSFISGQCLAVGMEAVGAKAPFKKIPLAYSYDWASGQFSRLGPPSSTGSGELNSVSCKVDTCTVVGYSERQRTNTSSALASEYSFTDETWSLIPVDIPKNPVKFFVEPDPQELRGISCSVGTPSQCVAVGYDDQWIGYGRGDLLAVTDKYPLQITTATLPAAIRTFPYSVQLEADGSIPPYAWHATGLLPKGLKLSADGVLSGTIKAKVGPGVYPIPIQVRADGGLDAVATTLELVVG